MSDIAIIDADLLGRKTHRFPNLALMKIAAWEVENGNTPHLLLSWEDWDDKYEFGWMSKVFTDTKVPDVFLTDERIVRGGTGFFYDRAPWLPAEIEHTHPHYGIYDAFVEQRLAEGAKRGEVEYYTDYSIGFLTRGCFRKCSFCVNRNSDKSSLHSPLAEFFDPARPKICLLDDNFFACADWSRLMGELRASERPFQFKQGLDERLLTEKKIEALFSSRTVGDIIFAFDNIADAPIIESKLALIRTMYPESKRTLKFYCFCGFDREDVWDTAFWLQDVFDLFERIRILFKYGAIPYVMRHAEYEKSPHRGMYVTLARWGNQPAFVKKKTFREFCEANGATSAALRYATEFERQYPEVAQYYDMWFGEVE